MAVLSVLFLSFLAIAYAPMRRAYFFPPSGLKSKPDTTLPFFDLVKGVGIIAVVIIHLTQFLALSLHNATWLISVNSICRFAIGLFFITSGALVHFSREKSIGEYLLPKFRRVLIPYLIVSIVLTYQQGAASIVNACLTGSASVPFYFVPILFQLYLIYPLIKSIRERGSYLPLFLAISLITFLGIRTSYIPEMPFFGRYLFFFMYGVYHADRLINNRAPFTPHLWAPLVCIYLCFSILYPETTGNEQYLYAVAMFEMLYYLSYHRLCSDKIRIALAATGKRSLWIFLLHYPVLELLFR